MKYAAWYGIIVGGLMLAQWGFFLAAGQVPELQTEPLRISFHLLAEFATALGLIASGITLLKQKTWAVSMYLLSSGMLLYSVVVSPGYFAQLGQWPMVGMFAVLLILAGISIWSVLRKQTGSVEGGV